MPTNIHNIDHTAVLGELITLYLLTYFVVLVPILEHFETDPHQQVLDTKLSESKALLSQGKVSLSSNETLSQIPTRLQVNGANGTNER